MLKQSYRFHGHGSLRYVYKNGQAIRSRLITMKYVANPRRKQCRVAVVISKKVLKSAVRRNQVRRRIYEVTRLEMQHFNPAKINDLVIMVFSSEVLAMEPTELRRLLTDIFSQAGLYQ